LTNFSTVGIIFNILKPNFLDWGYLSFNFLRLFYAQKNVSAQKKEKSKNPWFFSADEDKKGQVSPEEKKAKG